MRALSYDPHLDPQLVWSGKRERAEVTVPAPSIHVHEELSAEKIIGAVRRQRTQRALFDIDQLDPAKAVVSYRHELGWSNRMIFGDSLTTVGRAMPNVMINLPAPGTTVTSGQPIRVSGRATGTGGLELHVVASVTVRVDGGGAVEAEVTQIPHQPLPTAVFAASVTVPPTEGPHQNLVTATDDVGGHDSATVVVVVRATSVFPRFTPTARPIVAEVEAVAANRDLCSSIYLDTLESHGHTEWLPCGGDFEGEDHHQGLARTHQLSDGSVVFFLSHSETDEGDRGNLMHFRYPGPTEGEHVLTTSPLTVAPLSQLLEIEDQHPCDMSFLPEVGDADAGYLFVAEQRTLRVRVYRWSPADGLVVHGVVDLPHLTVGPNFVFLGAEDDRYLLGVVAAYDGNLGAVHVFTADAVDLFPGAVPGALDVCGRRRMRLLD